MVESPDNGPLPTTGREVPEAKQGFSPASVLLSFLMVAGGVCAALLALSRLPVATTAEHGDVWFVGAFAVGAFLGGFFAARASRGSTILEPALGAVLFVGTLGGLLLATPVGRLMWNFASEKMTQTALVLGGAALVGALLGSFLSEKLLGSATRSALPWILYVALAVGGGCFLSYLVAGGMNLGKLRPSSVGGMFESDRAVQLSILAGIAAGCVLAGLTAGASARVRVLAASFLGATAGVFGFFMLAASFSGSHLENETIIGAAVISVGGGVITVLTTAIGWGVVGRRAAG